MNTAQVYSSSVKSVGFDSDIGDLQIDFQSGRSYLYADVPETVYENLMESDSIGTFVNDKIKPKYNYTEI